MGRFTLIFLVCPFFIQSQILDVVEKGYYQVKLGDSLVSNHTKVSKANAKAMELRLQYPNIFVEVIQPNIEPDVDVQELVYLVNYNYNYADPGVTIYYGDKLSVQEPVLSDFDLFDVVVTDKYLNVLGEVKQGEIKNIEGIEDYDHFFIKYKAVAFADVVRKMKVKDGILMNY